ncbi:MAG: hypothetical protein IJ690_05410 [Clostridia bacterium]|nr:hypothetical protein [Clostridia bacterium]
MEDKILEILNNIVNSISNDIIPQNEKEKIVVNVNKNNSISFFVFNNILLKITFQKARMFIEFRKLDSISIDELSKKFEEVKYKENDLYVKVYIIDISEINQINDELNEVYKYLYLNEPIDTYGCCSRYVECSDTLKCINPDRKLARGCQYRNNLESGKIFYGKNKNI